MKNIYLFIISLFLSFNISVAQDYWMPLNGPEGVGIKQIGLDLYGNYYIGTFGIKNIFRSTDKGITWQNFEEGLPNDIYRYGFKFINAPDSSFYMIVKHKLYVIRPNSTVWERITGIGCIYNISINPNGDIYVSSSTSVYRSTDKGNSFKRLFGIRDEAELSTNGNNKNFVIDRKGDQSTRFYKFDDNGDNYKEIGVPGGCCLKGVFYDNNSKKLFIYSYDGLFMSENDGQSWNTIIDEDQPSPNYVVLSPLGTIYCDTYGKMIISKDLGQTWKSVPDSIYPFSYELKNILFQSDSSLLIYGNTSWQRSYFNFGIATEDFSSVSELKVKLAQTAVSNLSEDLNGTMYAMANRHRFYYSNDDWQTWKEINLGVKKEKIKFLEHDDNGNIIAISVLDNVYRSYNKGENWENISPWIDSLDNFESISISPKGTLYLLSGKKVLYISYDNGENWITKFNVSIKPYHNKFYFLTNDDIITVNSGQIRVSKDEGSTWKDLLENTNIKLDQKVVHVTKSDDILFVGEMKDTFPYIQHGLYKWKNNKLERLDSNANIWSIESIESNLTGDIFIAGGAGVFKLSNITKNWEEISFNLIYDINLYPNLFINMDQYIYACPRSGKIYKSINPTTNSHIIRGEVFYDEFSNCKKDTGEIEFYNWEVSLNGDVEKSITTNTKGEYYFNLPDGDYQIKLILPNSDIWQSCENNIDFSLNGSQLDTTYIPFPVQRITSTENISNKAKVKVYPQPFTYKTNIIIENFDISYNSVFELFNSLGEKVLSKNIDSGNFILYRNNLSNGIYFYKIEISNNKAIIGKLVIQ